MSLTNPINSTNIAATHFTDYFSNIRATYYNSNKPFSEFDDTTKGGIILGNQAPSQSSQTNVGTGIVTGSSIYNSLIAATVHYTNYRQVTPRRGVTFSDSRNGSSGTNFTNYTAGLTAHFGTSSSNIPRRSSSDITSLVSNSLTGEATSNGMQTILQNLFNAWTTLSTNSPLTVTVTVCHSSCHGSCHGSRSRR
jgi:hypothetical protein